ncbi:MAG: tRNA pseudouridine synthase [Chloroflexi bacterium]|nr:tRNA pseudouridine synthase [Chloroflexota bacterium]
MTRILRCTVEYDGTAFAGFQKQPGKETVQGALEAAIAKITSESLAVTGAGRTDAGVHAIGQVIHFRTASALPVETLQRAINACLSGAVRIRELLEADETFHARYSAVSREYRYLVENAAVPSALWRNRLHHVSHPLDVEAMDTAAVTLCGRHDFAAFGSPMVHTAIGADGEGTVEARGSTERTMFVARCWRQKRFVHFRFVADAFLRHMVRMVVGTLLRVGTGALMTQTIVKILHGDRTVSAGPAAPAHGLYLVHVRY